MAIRIKVDVDVNHHHHNHEKHNTGYFKTLSIYDGKQLLLTQKGKLFIMALSMNDTQQATGQLKFVDVHGHDTDVPDGNVSLDIDASVATASYDDPTNTVTVLPVAPGVTALKIKAKNAHGDDLPFDDIAIEIKSGDAVSGTINFTVSDQPTP